MCCSDLRPFNIVAGAGFKELAAVLFDIGLKSKRSCDISELLPVPNTVRNNVQAHAAGIRDRLFAICTNHFSSRVGAGFTTDLWSDTVRKNSFMSLTIHYLTEVFELHARTLRVKEVEGISHTADYLLGVFDEALLDYCIRDSSLCTVVTDCGANLCGTKGIPSKYHWMPCSDHKIATMITTVLFKTTSTSRGAVSTPFYRYYSDAPDLFDLLDRCKALVAYFKKNKLQNRLTTTLKQENVTRWNSQLTMLESILISFDEVTELLASRGKLVYINCIDKTLLVEIVRFLRPFQAATLKLEQWLHPTLHLDVYERHNLLSHLVPRDNAVLVDKKKNVVLNRPHEITDTRDVEVIPADSQNLVSIKNLMLTFSVPKWTLNLNHYLAAILDPRQKRRLHKFGVPETTIQQAKDKLVALMELETNPQVSAVGHQHRRVAKKNKKQKTSSGFVIVGAADLCSSDESDDENEQNTFHDELKEFKAYIDCNVEKHERSEFDLLK